MTGLTSCRGELDEAEAFAIEGAHRLKIHLVVGDLHHLVLEADGVAGGPGLETGLLVLVETVPATTGRGDMGGAGPQQRQRPNRTRNRAAIVKFGFDQVAWLEIRRVGIGDVLGQNALPLLVPLHLGA